MKKLMSKCKSKKRIKDFFNQQGNMMLAAVMTTAVFFLVAYGLISMSSRIIQMNASSNLNIDSNQLGKMLPKEISCYNSFANAYTVGGSMMNLAQMSDQALSSGGYCTQGPLVMPQGTNVFIQPTDWNGNPIGTFNSTTQTTRLGQWSLSSWCFTQGYPGKNMIRCVQSVYAQPTNLQTMTASNMVSSIVLPGQNQNPGNPGQGGGVGVGVGGLPPGLIGNPGQGGGIPLGGNNPGGGAPVVQNSYMADPTTRALNTPKFISTYLGVCCWDYNAITRVPAGTSTTGSPLSSPPSSPISLPTTNLNNPPTPGSTQQPSVSSSLPTVNFNPPPSVSTQQPSVSGSLPMVNFNPPPSVSTQQPSVSGSLPMVNFNPPPSIGIIGGGGGTSSSGGVGNGSTSVSTSSSSASSCNFNTYPNESLCNTTFGTWGALQCTVQGYSGGTWSNSVGQCGQCNNGINGIDQFEYANLPCSPSGAVICSPCKGSGQNGYIILQN